MGIGDRYHADSWAVSVLCSVASCSLVHLLRFGVREDEISIWDALLNINITERDKLLRVLIVVARFLSHRLLVIFIVIWIALACVFYSLLLPL